MTKPNEIDENALKNTQHKYADIYDQQRNVSIRKIIEYYESAKPCHSGVDLDKLLTDAICSVTCSVVEMDDKITPLREAIKAAIRPHLTTHGHPDSKLVDAVKLAIKRLQVDATGAESATQRRLNTIAVLEEALRHQPLDEG